MPRRRGRCDRQGQIHKVQHRAANRPMVQTKPQTDSLRASAEDGSLRRHSVHRLMCDLPQRSAPPGPTSDGAPSALRRAALGTRAGVFVCLFVCLFVCSFGLQPISSDLPDGRDLRGCTRTDRSAAFGSDRRALDPSACQPTAGRIQSSVRSEASALGDAMSRVEWLLCRASVCVCVCVCVCVGVGVRACVTVSARWFLRSHWWRTVAQVRRIQIVEAFNETLEHTCRGTYCSCTMLASIGPECLHAVASKRTWASRSPNPAGLDTCCLRAAFRVLTFALDS